MMDYYDIIIPAIVVYGSCIIGLFVALSTLNSLNSHEEEKPATETDSHKKTKKKEKDPSMSDSESSEQHNPGATKRPTILKLQNEMEFFKELGNFFKRDNQSLFTLIICITFVFSLLCYFYLNVILSLAFILGIFDFMFSFWFSRKLFVKVTLKLDFSSNEKRVCHKNWRMFLSFIFSCFIASISSTIMSVYTLLILYEYRIGPYLLTLPKTEANGNWSFLNKPQNAFVLLMAFYFIGKNLFHIFNNIWESYHMNNKILEFLIFDYLRKKSLEFYSQGYYYNIIIRIHRQNIIFSEVLVVLTIGVFEISEEITVFFVYFYTILLWYIIVFYQVSMWGFSFKNSIEAIGMTTILKIGFLYYFIMQFMFLYYRFFMVNDISVNENGGRATHATIFYAYLLMSIIFLVQKMLTYIFEPREIPKLKALQQDSNSFEFFLNDKVLFKLTITLLIVYMVYLLLGFVGIVFIFFYFSVQRLFYRIKKYILVFDLYIRILLWASRIASIHSFTFNKLLELVDKTYVQNFFMLLFIIPLYGNFRPTIETPHLESESYIRYLYVSLLSFVGSTLMLILYTKLVLQRYNETLAAKETKGDSRKKGKGYLIRHKMNLVVSGTILTSIYVWVFAKYITLYLMLAMIMGFAIHLMQLIYTNKIRVKKFLNVKLNRVGDDSFILKINCELSESTSYLKSVCELSFASILVEINKIMLLTYFFLQNLR